MHQHDASVAQAHHRGALVGAKECVHGTDDQIILSCANLMVIDISALSGGVLISGQHYSPLMLVYRLNGVLRLDFLKPDLMKSPHLLLISASTRHLP